MPFELAIFDCDGVLVDSEPLSNRVFTEALNELGLPLDYDEVCERFIGLSMARCIEMVEEQLGRPVPPGFVDDLQARTFEALRRGLTAVSGVAAALDAIDMPVCVASSGEPEKMRFTLGHTGLLARFEGRLFSATQVARGKPFPDLFLHAAQRMGATPARCAVIEDSAPGVQAARAAGMTVFGYAERADGDRLAAEGAIVFRDMRQLPQLLAATAERC